MNSRKQNSHHKPRDPDFAGAEIAMRRAAKRAQLRARETAKMAAANKGSARSGKIQGMRAARERGPRKSE